MILQAILPAVTLLAVVVFLLSWDVSADDCVEPKKGKRSHTKAPSMFSMSLSLASGHDNDSSSRSRRRRRHLSGKKEETFYAPDFSFLDGDNATTTDHNSTSEPPSVAPSLFPGTSTTRPHGKKTKLCKSETRSPTHPPQELILQKKSKHDGKIDNDNDKDDTDNYDKTNVRKYQHKKLSKPPREQKTQYSATKSPKSSNLSSKTSKSPSPSSSRSPGSLSSKAPKGSGKKSSKAPSATKAPKILKKKTKSPKGSKSMSKLNRPTASPSVGPSLLPSQTPSASQGPTDEPLPTQMPSLRPSEVPSNVPTTNVPTEEPTTFPPTQSPSLAPSLEPSQTPSTFRPTVNPSSSPSDSPSTSPSQSPTVSPTTGVPSASPTRKPTNSPSFTPTLAPTMSPTTSPTASPTVDSTPAPTPSPTHDPTQQPTDSPATPFPTIQPIDFLEGFPCDNSIFQSLNSDSPSSPYPRFERIEPGNPNSLCFLRMTRNENIDLSTSAFLGVPVNDPETFSFSMQIGYRIYDDTDGSADGMVFVMHQDERGATALGNNGGGIGVYGTFEQTIKPAVSIEWDTFFNPNRLDIGQDNIHVIQVNPDATLTELTQTQNVPIRTDNAGNNVGRMWVDYNCGGSQRLEIRNNNENDFRPTFPTAFVENVRLQDFFFQDGDQILYVGYTASIGGQSDNHDIFGWDFSQNC